VKAPRSWPKISATNNSSGTAPQLNAMNSPLRPLSRWTWRAISSLPVPVSPVMCTGMESSTASLSVSEQGDGMPFVFQHGLCGDADQLIQVFPEDTGYRCLTVECRGHGQSETGLLDDLSIPTFADDVAGYIQHLDRPVIGGISMGAAISLRIAVRWPHMIRALILARPAWVRLVRIAEHAGREPTRGTTRDTTGRNEPHHDELTEVP